MSTTASALTSPSVWRFVSAFDGGRVLLCVSTSGLALTSPIVSPIISAVSSVGVLLSVLFSTSTFTLPSFKRLSLIVRVNVVLNRSVVVDSD